MGFFSKMKNAVTGGAAKVYLDIQDGCRPGDTVGVHVRAVAKSDLEIDRVYLVVQGTEEAKYTEVEFEDGEIEREKEYARAVSTRIEVELAGAQELAEGSEYEWSGEFQLPPDVTPTVKGKIIFHSWRACAYLDAFGNDPDSGWITFHVG